ncbi:PKD protein [Tenacibaculum holothuriorum]|uniref:PKD protein n=1 Tax=Tenacibaculum holothuriorum TaxID=1635173 RepID=A0A1Y2PDY9_9FLAO|nr:hypothetical protein [Tenacibaculum holothuriorum]OSY88682.1 PKD protein [Tenacibaculum holothuriorum]
MKYAWLILISLLFFSCGKEVLILGNASFEGKIDKITTLGGSKNESAQAITKTIDGGFAIVGYTQSNDFDIKNKSNEGYDFWVLKYNSNAILEWSKTFGGSKDDRGSDIVQTSDGSFVVLGFSESSDNDVTNNAGNRDYWVAKITPNGNLLWQKSFGYTGNDYGTRLTKTKDNGFLITGVLDVSASGGLGNSRSSRRHAGGDFWAIKLNSQGNKEWSRYYGGTFTETPNGVVEDSEGNFIIAGSSDSSDVDIKNNKGSYDFWVIKIDSKGTLLWEKSFGGSEIDEARAMTKTSDGNFVIVGDTRSSDKDVSKNNGGADLWIIKINSDGNLLWEKSFGAESFDVARSVTETQDKGLLISGSSRSNSGSFNNKGQNDAWVLKLTSNGTFEWQKLIGGSKIDFCYDATELNNGNIIAIGESYSNDNDINDNKGFSDALIIKIK